MKIPVKITPDRIRDSVVQVFFQADAPFEPLIGICYSILNQHGWRYAARPVQSKAQAGIILEVQPLPQHFFIKENIKIQFDPNSSVIFNCIGSYVGWKSYSNIIFSVLRLLYSTQHFKNFTRVGIRYISEFANIDILDKIKININLKGVAGTIQNFSYRIALLENGLSKTINIANKLPVSAAISDKKEEVQFVSLMDIDVVDLNLSASDIEVLFGHIERLHLEEKKVFFGILEEHFLQTLNPEYA